MSKEMAKKIKTMKRVLFLALGGPKVAILIPERTTSNVCYQRCFGFGTVGLLLET